jgi:hypothetical protein
MLYMKYVYQNFFYIIFNFLIVMQLLYEINHIINFLNFYYNLIILMFYLSLNYLFILNLFMIDYLNFHN